MSVSLNVPLQGVLSLQICTAHVARESQLPVGVKKFAAFDALDLIHILVCLIKVFSEIIAIDEQLLAAFMAAFKDSWRLCLVYGYMVIVTLNHFQVLAAQQTSV
jgi:hypothetical protein